jgi:hypothetical protein
MELSENRGRQGIDKNFAQVANRVKAGAADSTASHPFAKNAKEWGNLGWVMQNAGRLSCDFQW